MEHLDGILKLADNELESIIKNGKFRSREEITSVGELIDMVKDIHEIWEYEDGGMEDEMSFDGGNSYRNGYRGESGRSYGMNGSSYARGRRGNVRRDSMGRYSRNGGNSYRYYDGYSREGEDFLDELRNAMNNAPDEQTRQTIQRMISQMEK